MSAFEKKVALKRGPRFYRAQDEKGKSKLYFDTVIDDANITPRQLVAGDAGKALKAQHPEAWKEYQASTKG